MHKKSFRMLSITIDQCCRGSWWWQRGRYKGTWWLRLLADVHNILCGATFSDGWERRDWPNSFTSSGCICCWASADEHGDSPWSCITCCCCPNEACCITVFSWFCSSSWQRGWSLPSPNSTILTCWFLHSTTQLGVEGSKDRLSNACGWPCYWSWGWCDHPCSSCCCKVVCARDFCCCCCKTIFVRCFLSCCTRGWQFLDVIWTPHFL